MTPKPFQIVHDGVRYSGAWEIDGDHVRVTSAHGARRLARARGKPADVAAAALHQIAGAVVLAGSADGQGAGRSG